MIACLEDLETWKKARELYTFIYGLTLKPEFLKK